MCAQPSKENASIYAITNIPLNEIFRDPNLETGTILKRRVAIDGDCMQIATQKTNKCVKVGDCESSTDTLRFFSAAPIPREIVDVLTKRGVPANVVNFMKGKTVDVLIGDSVSQHTKEISKVYGGDIFVLDYMTL